MNANTKQEVAAILRKKSIELINYMTDDELLHLGEDRPEVIEMLEAIDAIMENACDMFAHRLVESNEEFDTTETIL